MKTIRIRNQIKKFLTEQGSPTSTSEILDHINRISRHGTSSQQLGNVLSKDKDIVKIGMVSRGSLRYGTYLVCNWFLSDEYLGITQDDAEQKHQHTLHLN